MRSESNLLRPIVTGWIEKIKLAMKEKKRQFQDDADECMRFFNGPYNWMWGHKYATDDDRGYWGGMPDEIPTPSFRMSVNLAAEMVQLFGPALYHRNPIRRVTPRKEPILSQELFGPIDNPIAQQMFAMFSQQTMQSNNVDAARAQLLEAYLNYTPNELNLKMHSRCCIDEALVKGLGLVWHEQVDRPSGIKTVGSFFDSVDHLALDPDVECMDDCKWIARKLVEPIWEFEAKYDIPKGTIRGNYESYRSQGESKADGDADYRRKQGGTNDLVVYWKLYSRMGMGAKLSGVNRDLRDALDRFGDNCFLVVTDSLPYPANLPPDVIEAADEMEWAQRLRWPIEYWKDDRWPFTDLSFHKVARQLWPMSHLRPALGEIKLLNWIWSFIASKIRTISRDFIAVPKSVGEEMKRTILGGKDLELIEIEELHGNTIDKVVSFLQHPGFNGEVWRVAEAVREQADRRLGTSPLLYGMSATQDRSATETSAKQSNVTARLDDMYQQSEDFMSEVARKEAMAARMLLVGEDVKPILGPTAAAFWDQMITNDDPAAITAEYEYRIEAGSARKPNRETDMQNWNEAMQTLFPVLLNTGMQLGNLDSANTVLTEWAKSRDIDPAKVQLPQPPPPPAPPEAMQGQMDAAQAQQDMQHKEDSHGQAMRQSAEKHQLGLFQMHQKAKAQAQAAKKKAAANGNGK